MELDDAYANAPYIENAESFPDLWATKAASYREQLGARARTSVPYGESARQCFDLFLPETPPKGVIIFVHGGYWKAFDRSTWSHLARGGVEAGWAVACPGYDLCPDVRISEITRQISHAVEKIAGAVAGDIVLTGHSAGGHLVSRMLASGVLSDNVAARVVRVVPISPLSDLAPLLRTSMNDILGLDEGEARAESPSHQSRAEGVCVTVWVGGDERPAFLDQARWLAEAWQVEQVVVPGKHHFDIIEALEEADTALMRLLVGET